MTLKRSDSQITLVNPTFDNDPALVLLLKPDNVKQTTMTILRTGQVAYNVESNTSLTKCSVLRPGEKDPVALIERKDLFPDKITLQGEERQTIKSWLKGYGTFKEFPISFERSGNTYHWKINFVSQLALFNANQPDHPIAWFERSKKRVIDGKPVILQAWLAMEPEAISIQDAVVVSFLVVEHKLRTDMKAGDLVAGRASNYVF
ncbi:hypothetical protein NP233_g4912 [Leucocoprinus birnbaumii]|uniref:DUF6593 domain-containing protein n=1 Tax=Leucocoprinus birnbaumii TaxID=56174 RepID=A0AAD5VXH1_9AGAR|nr:hypothetical protein NP233_g4912 [Leucocoprinus birnbaumii]